MKKLINRVLGVVVAAALLVGTAMPNVAVMAAGTGHAHHGGTDETKLAPPAEGETAYTITLTKPKDVKVDAAAKFGAYQIFTGKVPETPENVKDSEYKDAYQNPGDKNAKLPITDIRWGNAFGEVNLSEWQANVVQFVIALGAASRSDEDGNTDIDYIFHDFNGFEDLVTGTKDKYYLANAYIEDGVTGNVTGDPSVGNLGSVKYDKLAVKVAQILEGNAKREWLQAFADILGGYTATKLTGTYDNQYLKQYYSSGTWSDDKCEIKVPAGYYMIIDQTDVDASNEAYSARMLFVANNVTQTLKEDVPTLDKEIKREENQYYDTEVAGVGDVVDFRLTGTLPSNYANYISGYQYKFVDTLSEGLTLENVDDDDGSVKITVTAKGLFKWVSGDTWIWDADKEVTILASHEDYTSMGGPEVHNDKHLSSYNYTAVRTKDKDNKDVLTVNFPCLREIIVKDETGYYSLGYNTPDPSKEEFGSSRIYVDYSAKVNQKAVVKPAEGGVKNGNTNTATLTYSNNPQSYTDTDDTTEQEATVYTFGLDIVKINAAEFLKNDGNTESDGVRLGGAKFALVRKNIDNKFEIAEFAEPNYTIKIWTSLEATIANPDNPDPTELQTAITTFLTKNTDGLYEVTSKADGAINIYGLDAGVKYTMVETKTPGTTDGQYAKINPFNITLEAKKDSSSEYDGTLSNATSDQDVKDGESFSLTKYVDITDPTGGTDNGDDGKAGMLVANFEYENLPSTGGIGIYPFYIIGGIVVAGSIILFALSRRKKTA